MSVGAGFGQRVDARDRRSGNGEGEGEGGGGGEGDGGGDGSGTAAVRARAGEGERVEGGHRPRRGQSSCWGAARAR